MKTRHGTEGVNVIYSFQEPTDRLALTPILIRSWFPPSLLLLPPPPTMRHSRGSLVLPPLAPLFTWWVTVWKMYVYCVPRSRSWSRSFSLPTYQCHPSRVYVSVAFTFVAWLCLDVDVSVSVLDNFFYLSYLYLILLSYFLSSILFIVAYLILSQCRAPADVGDHGLSHLFIFCHLQYLPSFTSISYCSYYSIHILPPSWSTTCDSTC